MWLPWLDFCSARCRCCCSGQGDVRFALLLRHRDAQSSRHQTELEPTRTPTRPARRFPRASLVHAALWLRPKPAALRPAHACPAFGAGSRFLSFITHVHIPQHQFACACIQLRFFEFELRPSSSRISRALCRSNCPPSWPSPSTISE